MFETSQVDQNNIEKINNPVLYEYVQQYLKIEENYLKEIQKTGLELNDKKTDSTLLKKELRHKGANFENCERSVYLNRISPACVACRKGLGTATFFISLQCRRSCFFCFNPNQENYHFYRHHTRDCAKEVQEIFDSHQKVDYFALTGGEPLLHQKETIAFFETVKKYFPHAHSRLYTCGDLIEEDILALLKEAGLKEIRFSIRLRDTEDVRRSTLAKIALAQKYIPTVMVEMPVLPGSQKEMQNLLLELDDMGIFGINLLEFCFPFRNAGKFKKNGFKIKNPPHRVLYNYWYAGGLPVAGSEEECLQLLDFALDKNLKLGVHYCSVENKYSGQLYQQNYNYQGKIYTFDDDYFLRSAKVFGDDIQPVLEVFKRRKFKDYFLNEELNYLEFPLAQLPQLKDLSVEIVVSTNVIEERSDGSYLRELRLDFL